MSDPFKYTIGWICATATEYAAAQTFLDEQHPGPEFVHPHDNNDYTLGTIKRHNVVIAVLPENEAGTTSAASVARDMLHSFPSVRIGLMVGVGSGAPSTKNDIRLGDVVVSAPRDGNGGVFQYDFGKTVQGQEFEVTGFLNQPPTLLRSAMSGLRSQYETQGHDIDAVIERILAGDKMRPKMRRRYKRPDASTDRLYRPDVVHPADSTDECATVCPSEGLVIRPARTDEDDDPAIHYGLIASANREMRDAVTRDTLAAQKNVLCFEREAAGLMNHFPCVVIRGICDYADTHADERWHGYAAMTAAAYTRDLVCRIAPNQVEAQARAASLNTSGQLVFTR